MSVKFKGNAKMMVQWVNSHGVSVPASKPVGGIKLFAGVILPLVCFVISLPDRPDWQSGTLDAYAQLLLSHRASLPLYPFLLYSMIRSPRTKIGGHARSSRLGGRLLFRVETRRMDCAGLLALGDTWQNGVDLQPLHKHSHGQIRSRNRGNACLTHPFKLGTIAV